jgi:hypothetical protein
MRIDQWVANDPRSGFLMFSSVVTAHPTLVCGLVVTMWKSCPSFAFNAVEIDLKRGVTTRYRQSERLTEEIRDMDVKHEGQKLPAASFHKAVYLGSFAFVLEIDVAWGGSIQL